MDVSPVTVDSREKEPGADYFAQALTSSGVSAHVGICEVGDFHWIVYSDPIPTPVYVERKTVQDLLASVEDGRLQRFTSAVRESRDTALMCLLVEGDAFYPSTYGRPWSAERLDNLLVSAQLSGAVVLRTRNSQSTAERIKSFYHYTTREEHNSLDRVVRTEPVGLYLDPEEKAKVAFLMGLPSVGEAKAKAVREEYDTLWDAILDYALWDSKVNGVGKGIVEKVRKFLHA